MKFTYNHIHVEEKDAEIEPAVQVKLEKHPWSKLALCPCPGQDCSLRTSKLLLTDNTVLGNRLDQTLHFNEIILN